MDEPDTFFEEPLNADEDIGQESEDDLETGALSFDQAVVTATDWTTETILSQLRRGNIQLNPRFQRRDAWTPAHKSRFIESLFLGLPIPQLVLAEERGRRGSYIVIDGKQRLLALRQFAASKDDEIFRPLRLSKLEARPDLNGDTLDDIQDDAAKQDSLAAFDNQTIRTVVVRNWPDESFLYLVFLRLNTGSVPLSPQELRQALHPGPFMDFADDFASKSHAIRAALRISRPDFRMRDVELLVRFFTFARFLTDYDGNLKRSLDRTCRRLNEVWDSENRQIEAAALSCDLAIEATIAIFGRDAFHRFADGKWENRFNRAVFDTLVFYFQDPNIARAATENATLVAAAYEQLSTDIRFQTALRTTTKSLGATSTRLSLWGQVLGEALGLELPAVRFDEKSGRIVVV